MSTTTQHYADPHTLQPNPWNTNVVSPENEAKIDASVKRFGMFKPIIVRTLADGTLQILGGAHRRDSAIRLKIDKVPVINLGSISDRQAKEIGLVDNGRYGNDDSIALSKLLDELGTPGELGVFLPYTDVDFESIFNTSNIALDELDALDLDDTAGPAPGAPTVRAAQTHAIMRFKVPVEDVDTITAKINAVKKRQRFDDEDSLTNAGNALVHIFKDIGV
jgi:ParB-like chromosome segregation protein Spo0J